MPPFENSGIPNRDTTVVVWPNGPNGDTIQDSMASSTEATAERSRNPARHDLWLAVLAFAGLVFLIFLERENWLYPLPAADPNYEVFPVTEPGLRGAVESPHILQSGGRLKVQGLLQSIDASVSLQKVVLYLDGRPMAVADSTGPAPPPRSAEANAKSWYWQINVPLKDTAPGEHSLLVRVLASGHAAVDVLQMTVQVLN